MRIRKLLIFVCALALAVPAVAGAQARRDADKVTGGGQVVLDSEDLEGPGDTVGFVATRDGGRVSGEFQIVRTSTAGGSRVTTFHGVVTCLEVNGTSATFGGFERQGNERGDAFTVDVQDNGQQGDDIIALRENVDDPCDGDNGDRLRLARGNLTVHDAQ